VALGMRGNILRSSVVRPPPTAVTKEARMRATRRRFLGTTAAVWATGGPAIVSRAQGAAWPSKPIRIIVPGSAGGVTDIRGRWLADRLSPLLGQPVVIDNKPGAGGNIAMAAAARSAPDGHTLIIIHIGTMAINPHLYENSGYNALTDFVPITRIGVGPQVLVVHRDVPARSVMELINLARSQPDKLTFCSPGVGTPGHLASSLLMHLAGIRATHIPYKGGGQAAIDLAAGHITWTIEGFTLVRPFVQDGRLRPLAVTTAQRNKALPDVPAMAEAGVPGYDFTAWAGIAAPAGTPMPIVGRLYDEIAQILARPDSREWFESLGVDPGGDPPDALAALVRAEHAKLGEVIRAAGIKAE
jgi:tripartite-type tricarboxylate transporter receptor subunit TctC